MDLAYPQGPTICQLEWVSRNLQKWRRAGPSPGLQMLVEDVRRGGPTLHPPGQLVPAWPRGGVCPHLYAG